MNNLKSKKTTMMVVIALILTLTFTMFSTSKVSEQKNQNGYYEVETYMELVAGVTNRVSIPVEEGDSLDAVGLYKGDSQIPAEINIKDATVEITTSKELPLDTAFILKAFTSNGKRYQIDMRTPEFMDFELKTRNLKMPTGIIGINTDGENGFIIKIPANPDKGFNYAYFIKLPMTTLLSGKAPYEMLIDVNNTGGTGATEEYFENQVEWSIVGNEVQYLASRINGVAVMPTFPRPSSAWEYYTHSLDRDSMLVTDEIIEQAGVGDFTRLDLQLKAIMEDAIKQCNANGLTINGKPMMLGFSASSDFANRYSLMHPTTIKALATSHATTLPISEYNGVTLNYPMGIADLKEISGITFNETAYKALPQFWFRGSEDNNDGTQYYDGWDTMGKTYRKAFGEIITDRKDNQVQIFKNLGYTNMKFTKYPGIGHWYTNEIFDDCVNFYNKSK